MGKITYVVIAIFMVVVMGMVYLSEARKVASERINMDPSMCTYAFHELGETRTLCVRDTKIDLECLHTIDMLEPFEDGTEQYIATCSKKDLKEVAKKDDTKASDWGPNGEGF